LKIMLFEKDSEPATFDEVFHAVPVGYRIPSCFELRERFELGMFATYEKDFYLYVWTVTYDFDKFSIPYYYVFDLATGKYARDYADKRFRACYIRED